MIVKLPDLSCAKFSRTATTHFVILESFRIAKICNFMKELCIVDNLIENHG